MTHTGIDTPAYSFIWSVYTSSRSKVHTQQRRMNWHVCRQKSHFISIQRVPISVSPLQGTQDRMQLLLHGSSLGSLSTEVHSRGPGLSQQTGPSRQEFSLTQHKRQHLGSPSVHLDSVEAHLHVCYISRNYRDEAINTLLNSRRLTMNSEELPTLQHLLSP